MPCACSTKPLSARIIAASGTVPPPTWPPRVTGAGVGASTAGGGSVIATITEGGSDSTLPRAARSRLGTTVANAGASYRFDTALPLEIGASVRHVGDRFNYQDNFVTMNAYTLYDAYAFIDVPKSVFNGVSQTRITFRVKNLTDKRYAQWGDPGYTDQVILGAPRSYEVAASFKW